MTNHSISLDTILPRLAAVLGTTSISQHPERQEPDALHFDTCPQVVILTLAQAEQILGMIEGC